MIIGEQLARLATERIMESENNIDDKNISELNEINGDQDERLIMISIDRVSCFT